MGDSNNLTLIVPDPPEHLRVVIAERYKGYAHDSMIYTEDGTEAGDTGELMLGANETSQGCVYDLNSDLHVLIVEGATVDCPKCEGDGEYVDEAQEALIGEPPTVTCERCDGSGEVKTEPQDFAFVVHDDPKYEWLGTIHMHVPGLDDFTGECDAEGRVVINGEEIVRLIDKATDLDELRAEIAQRTGAEHTKAF